MSKEISTCHASDYAGLSAGELDFYYGYEFGRTEDDEEIWGFRAMRGKEVVLDIPCDDKDKEKFDVIQKLLEGIGEYMLQQQRAERKGG